MRHRSILALALCGFSTFQLSVLAGCKSDAVVGADTTTIVSQPLPDLQLGSAAFDASGRTLFVSHNPYPYTSPCKVEALDLAANGASRVVHSDTLTSCSAVAVGPSGRLYLVKRTAGVGSQVVRITAGGGLDTLFADSTVYSMAGLALSRDERFVALNSCCSTGTLWDSASRTIRKLPGMGAAFSPDGTGLLLVNYCANAIFNTGTGTTTPADSVWGWCLDRQVNWSGADPVALVYWRNVLRLNVRTGDTLVLIPDAAAHNVMFPTWSGDGKRVAYWRAWCSGNPCMLADSSALYLLDLAAAHTIRITASMMSNGVVFLSGDGHRVVYALDDLAGRHWFTSALP